MSLGAKTILAFLLSLFLAYFTRTIIGEWLASNYAYSGSFIGPSNGENIDGFILSYIFFSALLGFIFSGQLKIALFLSIPMLFFNVILGYINPDLWLSLLLLALGLGLAWLILKLQSLFVQKRDTNKNG